MSRVSGQGFGRKFRLTNAREFERVFQRPNRSADKRFTVLARDNDRCHARLGLAIGTKHLRKSVWRSRVKRLIRESFRRRQGKLGGIDVVVMARPGIHAADNASLNASLERHWASLGSQGQGPC